MDHARLVCDARKISWGGRSALRDVSPRIAWPLQQPLARHSKTNVRVTTHWDVCRRSRQVEQNHVCFTPKSGHHGKFEGAPWAGGESVLSSHPAGKRAPPPPK